MGNIVRGRRGITAETALRLERALGMSAQTWMNLQALYDLEKATAEAGRRIKQTTERLNPRDVANPNRGPVGLTALQAPAISPLLWCAIMK